MRTTVSLSISYGKNVFLLENFNKNTFFLHEMDKLTAVLTYVCMPQSCLFNRALLNAKAN